MANQIVVSAGAKVRNLSGVLTGTSGVVSSVPLGAANGVATLDSGGKVPVSQLPSSVVTYLGTWDAATNTPTLANGTGDAGDMYICNVAGTVNFGAGPVVFVVGDWVLYGSGTWQKSSGQNGTVTSVAITETGDSLNITGSPITTSGTINIGFNGTNLQYVNGAGNLTTFPILTGYVPYTGATANLNLGIYSFIANDGAYNTEMSPSYFGVENAAGTIFGLLEYNKLTLTNSTGAGSTMIVNAQGLIFPDASVQTSSYTDAKARLALSLTTTGTSGVATYNNATGVFNIPNYGSGLSGYVPYTGATQDVDLGAFKLNAQSLHIKGTGGNGHLGLKHQSASATASANEVSLFADSLGDLSWLNGNLYLSKFITSGNTAARSYTFPDATCNIPNDSLVVHLAGTETITGAKTFSGGVTFSSSVTTNNLTFANSGFFLTLQPPTLSVNRTVTLPNATGTLALTSDISYPVTSVFGRTGAVVATSGDYTTAQVTESGNLYFTDSRARLALSFVAGSGAYNSTTGVITIPTNNNQITNGAGYTTNVGTVTSVAALTIGTSGTDLSSSVATSTTTPVITLNVPTASALNRGALSSTDWTTFNNKQSALTNPVTGTGNNNYIAKFTSTGSTIGNSLVYDNGTSVFINASSGGYTTPRLLINNGAGVSLGLCIIADGGGRISRFQTADYNNTNTGSSLRFGFGAASGNTSSEIVAYSNGESLLNSLVLNGAVTIASTGNVSITDTSSFGGQSKLFSRITADATTVGKITDSSFHIWNTTNVGSLSQITFGYTNGSTTNASIYLGLITTNGTGTGFGDFVLGTAPSANAQCVERLRIASTGAATFSSTITLYDVLRLRSSSYGASYNTSLRSDGSAIGILQLGNNGDNYILGGNTGAGGYLIFRVNCASESIAAGIEALRIASTGAATFSSSVTATSFFESSDSRLKTLIQDNYQTKGIASITPKLYTKNGKVELGYYAQDLVGILDSAVSKGEDDMLSLSYREVLVAKVYALEQEIKELKAKMN